MTIKCPDITSLQSENIRKEFGKYMIKIDTTEAKKYLDENLGEQVADNIYYFHLTGCWIFKEHNDIVAFEDCDANVLYIFDTVQYLSKFIQDNHWTYDAIIDFESASTCYYVEDENDQNIITSHLEIGNLDQEDVANFIDHCEYLKENW